MNSWKQPSGCLLVFLAYEFTDFVRIAEFFKASVRRKPVSVNDSTWCGPTATRTPKAIRPAKIEQILSARFIRREPLFEFDYCPGIILSHRGYYMLGSVESVDYP